jgi:hypothetical protein
LFSLAHIVLKAISPFAGYGRLLFDDCQEVLFCFLVLPGETFKQNKNIRELKILSYNKKVSNKLKK